jgi:hypothetical protein
MTPAGTVHPANIHVAVVRPITYLVVLHLSTGQLQYTSVCKPDATSVNAVGSFLPLRAICLSLPSSAIHSLVWARISSRASLRLDHVWRTQPPEQRKPPRCRPLSENPHSSHARQEISRKDRSCPRDYGRNRSDYKRRLRKKETNNPHWLSNETTSTALQLTSAR